MSNNTNNSTPADKSGGDAGINKAAQAGDDGGNAATTADNNAAAGNAAGNAANNAADGAADNAADNTTTTAADSANNAGAGNADNAGADDAIDAKAGNADNAKADSADSAGDADDALAAARRDAAEKHELLMRKAAELENFRRRADRDMENAVNLAMEQIALAICEVRDSVVAAMNDENQTADDLRQGVKVILQKTDSVLQTNNIKPVHPDCGVIFDPELHMAVATEENAELPANAIVRILQTGYTINSRLLRPASVIVSKAKDQNGGGESA